MAADQLTRWARVTGTVQGVNYRQSTRRRAESLGLRGWVKNTDDGAVELCAQGPAQAVQQLMDWCQQGPAHAVVDAVEVLEPSADQQGSVPASGFQIIR